MLSDNVQFDIDAGFEDGNYKSCFARSVVVNSQYQQLKVLHNQQQLQKEDNCKATDTNKGGSIIISAPVSSAANSAVSKSKRGSFITEGSRSSCSIHGGRRSYAYSTSATEMPVENVVLKSQIKTLEWQLKHTEASREMYKAVMKQVVKFLERAHRNLQILGSKLNTTQQLVSDIENDHHMMSIKENTLDGASSLHSVDYTAFRDFTWRRQKRTRSSPEEIPLEKLSQEAFRLLRTAQSLLNTCAPDLAHLNGDASEDVQFLEQLAKEFPRGLETPPPRPVSEYARISEGDIRVATALTRKLSLQQNSTDFKHRSLPADSPKLNKSTKLHSDINGECRVFSSTLNSSVSSNCSSTLTSYKSFMSKKDKSQAFNLEPEKSTSPPISSVSSAEDESGFSSMNSFQELGIPLMLPLSGEDKTTDESLIQGGLRRNSDAISSFRKPKYEVVDEAPSVSVLNGTMPKAKDVQLWQKPFCNGSHKRWNSTPVKNSPVTEKEPLKVLWV